MSDPVLNQTETNRGTVQSCPACQRAFSLPPNWVGVACPICQLAPLTPTQDTSPGPDIELIVPPGLDMPRLQEQLKQFAKGVPFATPDFSADHLAQRLILIYWPVWLADADLNGEWDASFGYDYQVKSAREQLDGSEWASQTVIKTRVNDEPRKGFINRHYDNILAPAINTHTQRLTQLGEYDLHAARSWHPTDTAQVPIQRGYLSPHEVEDPVKQTLTKLAALDCRAASNAQHTKSFTFYGGFDNMHWTQGLLPIFTSFYEDEKGQRQGIAINGQTGKIYGRRMASMKKALLLTGILLAISLILMLVLYFAEVEAYLCFAPAFLVAWVPLIRAGIWNSKEKAKPPLA